MARIRPFAPGDLEPLYQLVLGSSQREGIGAAGSYRLAIGSPASFEGEMCSRDYPPESRFLVCDNGGVSGAIGFDRDHGDTVADLEGPFLDEQSGCSEDELFAQLIEVMKAEGGLEFIRYVVYSNVARQVEFAARHSFEEFREPSLYMELPRGNQPALEALPAWRLEQTLGERSKSEAFEVLDSLLPGFCRTVEDFEARVRGQGYCLLSVFKGDAAVARGLFRGQDGRQYLIQFLIAERFRGQGLGRPCLTLMLEEMFRGDCDVVSLSVSENNQAAVRLYRGVGFIAISGIHHTRRPLRSL